MLRMPRGDCSTRLLERRRNLTTAPRRTRVPAGRDIGSGSGLRDLDDVLCLKTLGPLDPLPGDAAPFLEGAETFGDDRGVMDEDVRASLPHDETVALGVVEPLHGTLLSHTLAPCSRLFGFAAIRAAAMPPDTERAKWKSRKPALGPAQRASRGAGYPRSIPRCALIVSLRSEYR